jgi:competence protein ComEC
MLRKNLVWYLILFLILVNGVIWFAAWRLDAKTLTVAFLDVGQGDAIYIEAPNGNQMLIDGGPNAAVLRELGKVMPFFDRSIDVVMETHPDADHIGGLGDVFSRFEVSYFLEPGIPNDTSQTITLLREVEREDGVARVLARRGMVVDLGQGVLLEILFPDRDVETIETNTGSIVARLHFGETSVLLTGDSPSSIETYLVRLDPGRLDSDILKLGHHGSHTSTSKGFVEAVSPKVAIISAGKDNRYGHPHKDVLQTLDMAGVPYVSTADLGTIQFESNGAVFTKK